MHITAQTAGALSENCRNKLKWRRITSAVFIYFRCLRNQAFHFQRQFCSFNSGWCCRGRRPRRPASIPFSLISSGEQCSPLQIMGFVFIKFNVTTAHPCSSQRVANYRSWLCQLHGFANYIGQKGAYFLRKYNKNHIIRIKFTENLS